MREISDFAKWREVLVLVTTRNSDALCVLTKYSNVNFMRKVF